MTERGTTFDPNNFCLLGIASTKRDVKRNQGNPQTEVGIASHNQEASGQFPSVVEIISPK